MWGSILACENLGRVLELLGQVQHSHVLDVVVALDILRSEEDSSSQCQRCACHDGRFALDKVFVIKGDLAEVKSHVLHFNIVRTLPHLNVHPSVDRRAAHRPVQRIQHMPFHLGEHLLII